MLIERYEHVNLFDPVPLERDAILDEMDQMLDEESNIYDVAATKRRRDVASATTQQRTLHDEQETDTHRARTDG
jgi:hypothetical protein